MVKRKISLEVNGSAKKMVKTDSTPTKPAPDAAKSAAKDPWSAIEDGSAQSAHTTFYGKHEPAAPFKENAVPVGKRKSDRMRLLKQSDGSHAQIVTKKDILTGNKVNKKNKKSQNGASKPDDKEIIVLEETQLKQKNGNVNGLSKSAELAKNVFASMFGGKASGKLLDKTNTPKAQNGKAQKKNAESLPATPAQAAVMDTAGLSKSQIKRMKKKGLIVTEQPENEGDGVDDALAALNAIGDKKATKQVQQKIALRNGKQVEAQGFGKLKLKGQMVDLFDDGFNGEEDESDDDQGMDEEDIELTDNEEAEAIRKAFEESSDEDEEDDEDDELEEGDLDSDEDEDVTYEMEGESGEDEDEEEEDDSMVLQMAEEGDSDDDEDEDEDEDNMEFGDGLVDRKTLLKMLAKNNQKIGKVVEVDEDGNEIEDEDDEDEDEEEDDDEEMSDEDEEVSDEEGEVSIIYEKEVGSDDEEDEECEMVDGECHGCDCGDADCHEDDDEMGSEATSDSSHVSDDSYGEANLGEDRQAGIITAERVSTMKGPDFTGFPFSDLDSGVTATKAFAWMIAGAEPQAFFDHFYQHNAMVVKRQNKNYYNNLFSTKQLSELLEKNYVEYGKNINIAEYKNGQRYTMNGEGRVYPYVVSQHIKLGRSVQLVNPQTFSDSIWYLCEVLQEMFGCFVGANTYLTPAGSAGFAPHWDEIDAFLLQLEGRKYWKVYAPQSDDDELPRESSGNFSDADMAGRTPCFEGWIEQGDLLYIPRGFIHNAKTDKNTHSLHVTISTGRQWAFADMMDKVIPDAVQSLAAGRMKLRRGLPVGMLDMMGVAPLEYRMEENAEEKLVSVFDRHMSVLRRAVTDAAESAVDMMAREFIKTSLPPRLTTEEKKMSVHGASGFDLLKGRDVKLKPSTEVRFIRRHAQRLIFENEETMFVVHRMNNSRVYEGREEQEFSLPMEMVEGFCQLQSNYPEWTTIEEMLGEEDQHKVGLVELLYSQGLVMIKQ